ncbi:MAG: EscU/YscU/HrcU family type III secretion system export apparatus switch protein [Bosea sp. (in: a-proteobacteria)]
MADGTEEKKHAPTNRRLSQLRNQEGQVGRSRDFPASVSLIAAMAYLIINFGPIWQQIAKLFDIYEVFLFRNDTQTLLALFKSSMEISVGLALPVAAIASLTFIFASVLQTKGLVLSFKSVSPNFTRLNPVEGIGRIFGVHGLSEALKIIAKVLFMAIAVYIIMRWTANGLFWSPTCEEGCVLQASIYIIIAVIIAALIIFFIVGVIDIWITMIIFKHDNRMTETELQREIKDDFGSKEIRQRRRDQRREDARTPAIRGFGKATVIAYHGDALVGLAYIPGKFDIPIVVGKLYQERIAESLAEAKNKGVPIIQDEAFVQDLMRYTRVGEPLPQPMIMSTAQIFVKSGVVKRR